MQIKNETEKQIADVDSEREKDRRAGTRVNNISIVDNNSITHLTHTWHCS